MVKMARGFMCALFSSGFRVDLITGQNPRGWMIAQDVLVGRPTFELRALWRLRFHCAPKAGIKEESTPPSVYSCEDQSQGLILDYGPTHAERILL